MPIPSSPLMVFISKDTQAVWLLLTWVNTNEREKQTGDTDKMHYECFWTLVLIYNKWIIELIQLLSTYSSQAIEQLNRVLKRLVSSVSYMTPSNFKMVVTIFMASQNYLRRKLGDSDSEDPNGREIDWLIEWSIYFVQLAALFSRGYPFFVYDTHCPRIEF